MRRILPLLAIVLAVEPLFADDKTMIELQLELNKRPSVKAKTQPIAYVEAQKLATKTGQPVFISVGLNCRNCCGELRSAGYLTVHEHAPFMGDAAPRAILAIPSKGQLYFGKQWPEMPSPSAVKQAFDDWKAAHPGMVSTESIDMNDAMAVLARIVTGIEPVEWTPLPPGQTVQYRQVCENGNCQQVPVGVTYSQTDGSYSFGVTDSGEFVADFPIVSRGRHAVRRLLGRILRRPVQDPITRGHVVSTVSPAQAEGEQAVAGGPLRKLVSRLEIHLVLKQAVASGTLTTEQKAVADRMLADPNIYEVGVSTAKLHLDRKAAGGGPVGKLGDGTLLTLLIQNLPAILNDVAAFLKVLGIIK